MERRIIGDLEPIHRILITGIDEDHTSDVQIMAIGVRHQNLVEAIREVLGFFQHHALECDLSGEGTSLTGTVKVPIKSSETLKNAVDSVRIDVDFGRHVY